MATAHNDGFTGRVRHREQKRFLRSSLLVLQAEVKYYSYNDSDPRDFERHRYTAWRDITPGDLALLLDGTVTINHSFKGE